MKLNVLATSLVLSSALFSGATLAADGTVHFRGEVIDSTCTVTTDTSNQTVNIGRVAATTFAGIDSTASVKDFLLSIDWSLHQKNVSWLQILRERIDGHYLACPYSQ